MKKIVFCALLLATFTLNVYPLTPVASPDPAVTVPTTGFGGQFYSYMIDNSYLVIIVGPKDGPFKAGKIKIDGSRMVEYIMARLVITNAMENVFLYTPEDPPTLKFITHNEYISGKDVNVADLEIIGVKFSNVDPLVVGIDLRTTYDRSNLQSISFFKEKVPPARTIFNVNLGILSNDLKVLELKDYSFEFQETVEFDYFIGQFVQFFLSLETFRAFIFPVPFSGTNITGFRFKWTEGTDFNHSDWPRPASRSLPGL